MPAVKGSWRRRLPVKSNAQFARILLIRRVAGQLSTQKKNRRKTSGNGVQNPRLGGGELPHTPHL